MQREKIKTVSIWLATAVCMMVIFWLSSRTSDESSGQSSIILTWLTAHFGDNFFTDFIVRKTAHFLEFAGLAFLFNCSLFQTRKIKSPICATMLTSLYALSDEIHQLFVEGRSCQATDWLLDTCGALFGTALFLTLLCLITYVNKRKNTIDRKNNSSII